MGQHTLISWCDSTVNPSTGCDGCELHVPGKGGPCYAGILHEGRLARSLPTLYAPTFTDVRMAPGRMNKASAWPDLTGVARPDKPWLDGQPRVIFVGDMGDVLSKAVSFEYLRDEVISNIVSPKGRRHLWLILTKRPRRTVAFSRWLEQQGIAWPDNVMTGTSVTTQATAIRVGYLLEVPGRRFVSAEPMKGPVDFDPFLAGLSLLIVGGESGAAASPMHPDWARSVRDQCVAAGVPFLFKQHGQWVPVDQPWEQDSPKPLASNERWCNLAGGHGFHGDEVWRMRKVGKEAAGAVLDGRQWHEFPKWVTS